MDKSYRIHTNISQDTLLQVNMEQDFDFLEVLSLKLSQKDAYRLHSSNYGVIVGRVLANDAFGIPNAKVSVFIERDANDSSDMEAIYPYAEVTTKDKQGRRYNLLPDYSDDDCYRVVGTFPNKRLVLDDSIQLEIYEKYWKYTTVTNNAGDYMIFGVPTGSVTVHIDIDLSDIGVLSQKPRDFEYKGYNLTMFDSPNQFKESTNLDGLAQLFSQNKSVFVYPFWGDTDNGVASITRSDIQIQYKFEPTCVFMGSIVSDNEGHAIGHKCAPDVENGMNNQLVGGSGTIEMIRKTTDGLVEEYQIQGNQLIDNNGVWCYQIPMNLDFIGTDEYGNIVPTGNPNKGIPTRAQVRFRISKNETSDEGFSRHTAKYLVPMNPILSEDSIIPQSLEDGHEIEKMYTFGSATPMSCFRDLYWNNVYSVKNYIPKTQVAHRPYSKNYSALKGSNLADDQNPIPFNKLRIDMPFLYMVVCLIYTIMVWVVTVINGIISVLHFIVYELCIKIPVINKKICPFKVLKSLFGDLTCITLSASGDEGNVAYYPGCSKKAMRDSSCPGDMEDGCQKSSDKNDLVDKIQRNLALEFKIVKLDFYQDWINGCLYMPLWYWRKRRKKSFLFGLLKRRARNDYCSDSRTFSRLKTSHTCNITYTSTSFDTSNSKDSMPESEKRWHKRKVGTVYYSRGLIKQVENKEGLLVYYYACGQATSENKDRTLEMDARDAKFNIFRLYATDIILLGNLDPNNIYGIPQFYKCLPSTTSNVPPIATIEEDDETNSDSKDDGFGDEEESGTTITTGMDWNNNGGSQVPMYKTGLFMDLACTYAATRPKSCINVERLSELGVSLDMTQRVAYGGTNGIQYGEFEADGFINKLDLEDMENRAMFATLNHMGFIPQEYQDSVSGYTTQVLDNNTNYLIPKFKYVYSVDFDGRLQAPMDEYRNGFEQALEDVKDQSYITFRMGAEEDNNKDNNSEERIRHFYHADSNKSFSMPLYNNSYYFYFGITKGSTAIDKFNEMFDAPCVKNSKKPFSLDVETRGKSYCPEAYSSELSGNSFAYIRVTSDDIRSPYTYALYDAIGNLVITEDDMTVESFVIGGYIDESGNTKTNEDGVIKYQLLEDEDGNKVILKDSTRSAVTLVNQTYTVELIDSEGRRLSEKVELEMPLIGGTFGTTPLGTKFFDSGETRIDYICNSGSQFYGTIDISGITIDGRDCAITSASTLGIGHIGTDNDGNIFTSDTSSEVVEEEGNNFNNDSGYIINLALKCDEIDPSGNLSVCLYLRNTTKENVKECLCDKDNEIASAQSATTTIDTGELNGHTYAKLTKISANEPNNNQNDDKYVLTFFVYQPSDYIITLIQYCTGTTLSNENMSSTILNVRNGEPFEAYLNGMPIRFMLGKHSTSNFINDSNFYALSAVTNDTTSKHIKGWYGVHQEDAYRFPIVRKASSKTWQTFLGNEIADITKVSSKLSILKYKFQKMFSLSDVAYFTESSPKRFKYSATGGVSPILYRSFAPTYNNEEKMTQGKYIFSDSSDVSLNEFIPNIVTKNYLNVNNDGPQFNIAFGGNSLKSWVGNYFAAFTKDGGYTSKTNVDESIVVEKKPAFAVVNPDEIKKKGKDVEKTIDTTSGNYTKIHTEDKQAKTFPYLRALSVDRRLDYDLTIMAPAIDSNFTLYDGDSAYTINRDGFWKGARIFGTVYNGIEMAYDEDYNIITANTIFYDDDSDMSGEVSAVTESNRLEYTYYAVSGESHYHPYITSDDKCHTKYNSGSTDSVWGSWNVNGYDASIDVDNRALIKQFYSAEINGIDVRNMFWSDFNKNRLNTYTTNNSGWGANPYVFKYPYTDSSLYNGDFNMDDVAKKRNYPTKRYIDIGKLSTSTYFNFEISSCDYSSKPVLNEDETITCETSQGDTLEFEAEFGRPITVLPPNDGTNNYCNINYKFDYEGSRQLDVTAITLTADAVKLFFKYNNFSVENFSVYTRTPRIICVLPYFNVGDVSYDGISYIKTCHSKNGDEIGITETVKNAIKNVTVYDINYPLNNYIQSLGINLPGVVILPNGVSIETDYPTKGGVPVTDDFWFYKGSEKEYLASDDALFEDIRFNVDLSLKNSQQVHNATGLKAFAILAEREYRYVEDDNLTRHIRTIETSEIFDCRNLRLETDSANTYVELSIPASQSVEVITSVTAYNESNSSTEGGGDNNNTNDDPTSVPKIDVDTGGTNVSDTTKIYSQTVGFKLIFDNIDDSPEVRMNEAFLDVDRMSYTFVFEDRYGAKYEIVPEVTPTYYSGETITIRVPKIEIVDGLPKVIWVDEEITTTGSMTISLIAKWTTDMGLLSEGRWGWGGPNSWAKCKILAKTPSNFIYQIDNFSIRWKDNYYKDNEDGTYEQTAKEDMEPNIRYYNGGNNANEVGIRMHYDIGW